MKRLLLICLAFTLLSALNPLPLSLLDAQTKTTIKHSKKNKVEKREMPSSSFLCGIWVGNIMHNGEGAFRDTMIVIIYPDSSVSLNFMPVLTSEIIATEKEGCLKFEADFPTGEKFEHLYFTGCSTGIQSDSALTGTAKKKTLTVFGTVIEENKGLWQLKKMPIPCSDSLPK